MSAILECRDVTARYGESIALHEVSITVAEGELLAVIGSNGAGKSTLMRVISGLVRPWRGSVVFEGNDITGRPSDEIVKRGIAHAPEGRRIFPGLTVQENLRLGAFFRKDRAWRSDLERVYDLFPQLKDRVRQLGGTLSGGEQQMLAIGRALMSAPRILLLDEPSLGLAPMIVEQVMDAIRGVASRGVTTVLVEQDASWALRIADRAYVLEAGWNVKEGSASELADDESVREAYLGI